MGWETNCAQRPGASASSSVTTGGGTILTRDGSAADETQPLRRGGPSLAESVEKRRDDLGKREWSRSKHVCIALLFLVGLWTVCFALTAMSIEALLRVTSSS